MPQNFGILPSWFYVNIPISHIPYCKICPGVKSHYPSVDYSCRAEEFAQRLGSRSLWVLSVENETVM